MTSTYITNPSFELGKTGEAFTSAESGAFDAPYSWTTDANFPSSGTRNFGIFQNDGKTPSNFGKAVEPANGTYYYLGRNSWASSLNTALTQTSKAALPAGIYVLDIAYKLGTNTSNGATNGTLKLGVKKSGTSLGEVNSEKAVSANGTYFNTASWSRMAVPFTVDSESSVDFIITFNFNPSVANTPQEAIIIDDVRLYDLGTASANNGVDVSGFVMNNNFNASTEGWTSTTGASSNKLASNKSGAITGNFYENWKNAPYTGKISQTLTGIPNGVYKLTAASFFNQASTYADHVKVFANDDAEFVTAQETPEFYSVFTKVTDNSLEIGVNKVSSEGESGDNWIGIDNVSLEYYGNDATVAEVKLASFVAAYNTALDRAKAFNEAGMFASDWSALQSAISANTLDLNDSDLTESDLTTATSALETASDAADIAVAQKTYDTAVSAIGGSTNVDLTSLLTNPSFETNNLTGWTNTNAETQTNKSFDNVQGNIYAQRWHFNGNVDLNQTIVALPAGYYQVSAYSYFSETGARVYANSTEVAVTTSGKYSVVVEITDKGSINLGAGCTSTSTSWWCVDDFKLTYLASSLAELPYTLATGKLGTDKLAAQATAEEAFTDNPTLDTYNALLEAINAAEASKANYTALKTAIDKAEAVKEANNFVTADATTAFTNEITTASNAWTNVTYTDAQATNEAATLGSTVSGWHAIANEGAAGAYIASAWGKTSENWWDAPYINTWSTEGDNDGTGFSVPFFEYFANADQNLPANTMTATLTGLENGRYQVEIWARVQRRSDADFNGDNSMITMNVNGGEAVSIMNGSTTVGTGGSTMRLGRFTAEGEVTDGTLTLSIDVKLGANVHWLSWRDVKYTKLNEANMTIAAGKYGTFVAPFDVTIPDGVTAEKVTGVSSSTLVTEEVTTTIPANTPVLVSSEAAVNTTFYGKGDAVGTVKPDGQLLTGVYEAVEIPAGSYVLQTQDGVQAFYKLDANATANTVNRAYLTVPASPVKAFFFNSDDADAIKSIEATDAENTVIYNLAGERVSKAQKGLYIQKGKKMLVK